MFEGPEYASYVALCRDHRLEREFEEGDWYASLAGYVSPTLPGTPMLVTKSELRLMAALKSPERTAGLVWLPRLDQLVTMLDVEFGSERDAIEIGGDREVGFYWETHWKSAGFEAPGASHEEAALRLVLELRATRPPRA